MATNTMTSAETTTPNQNVRTDLLHKIHSLAPIYDVNEFNMKTGQRLTQQEYMATINFLNVDTKEETLAKCRRMADKTYERLLEAKHTYCDNKALYGVIPGISR